MTLVLVALGSLVVGAIIGAAFGSSSKGGYDDPNYMPLANAGLDRLRERTQDYYNNPVVEYMKKHDR